MTLDEKTIAELLPEDVAAFLRELERRGSSPHTIRNYRHDLVVFARWFETSNGEAFSAVGVTPTDVRRFKSYQQTVQKLAPATINRRLATLQSFGDWAVATDKLVANPAGGVKRLETPQLAPKSLSTVELNRLTRAAEKEAQQGSWLAIRNLAIVQLLRYTGLRVGEFCALTGDDIHMSERKGHVVVRSGKGEKHRQVPLNAPARRALRAYLEARPVTNTDRILVGRRGPLSPHGVGTVVSKLARLAGVDEVTPHVLRHSFGRGLLDSGADVVTVAALLGHAKLETTMIYTQPAEQDLADAVGRLEA
jgi:integrase/recombinase XerC